MSASCQSKGCGAFAVESGNGFCFSHSPALSKERVEARRKGGRARATQQKRKTDAAIDRLAWLRGGCQTSEACRQGLAYVTEATLRGDLGAREAAAITSALRLLLGEAQRRESQDDWEGGE